MIDSHCHFDFAEFDHARTNILRRCQALPLAAIVVPGTERSRWQQVKTLSQRYPEVFYALGLHPYFLARLQSDDLDVLRQHLANKTNTLIAVGEIGLDAAIDIDMALQQVIFQRQLDLASEFQLPVILHQRKTAHQLLQALKGFELGGVLHGFSGSKELACSFIDRGFKVGIGGVITYPRANKTRQAVASLPLDALVLETDAPDMPVNGFQGQANSPERLANIVSCLCGLRPEPEAVIREALWQNTLAAFPRLKSLL
ncbi:TatD family deoxyribonuclease [Motilimonas pumila]|uniref:TatD family deoxyribonuclease n=1 Tax=Motilimonas pumila TaxID=2303987 RepID=A0A418YL04_9GAMM|nr:TatD family deoxyribonuclease [Motilimonas pumila]